VSHTSRCEPHGQERAAQAVVARQAVREKTVRAAQADKQKTNKRRTKDEQKTVRATRADREKTKERQTNDEEMIKDKACKIVGKVEFVEGDYG